MESFSPDTDSVSIDVHGSCYHWKQWGLASIGLAPPLTGCGTRENWPCLLPTEELRKQTQPSSRQHSRADPVVDGWRCGWTCLEGKKVGQLAHVCCMEAWVRERCPLVPTCRNKVLLQIGKLVPKGGKRESWPNPSPDEALGRAGWYFIWQHNRADHTEGSKSDLAPRESEQESWPWSLLPAAVDDLPGTMLRAHPGGVSEGYWPA